MVPMIKEYNNFVPLNCIMHLNSQVSSGGPTGRRGRPVPPRAGRAHSQEIECVKTRRPLPWTTAARETHSNIEHVQITHVSGIFWHLMTTLTSQKTKHNNFANTCVGQIQCSIFNRHHWVDWMVGVVVLYHIVRHGHPVKNQDVSKPAGVPSDQQLRRWTAGVSNVHRQFVWVYGIELVVMAWNGLFLYSNCKQFFIG